eukprot:CAMPEP_0170096458 /NCGR_PEP_ID=MMETSP0019_2-20121128/28602_1 /TAXON_ID=98059 /ORGANISM="Dinobryon sp., Strain UTEXLB2267" /LENGTH=41 /DNA_ID= /DNA_START= /DNA_END= /DNA_ORIENTATION=
MARSLGTNDSRGLMTSSWASLSGESSHILLTAWMAPSNPHR